MKSPKLILRLGWLTFGYISYTSLGAVTVYLIEHFVDTNSSKKTCIGQQNVWASLFYGNSLCTTKGFGNIYCCTNGEIVALKLKELEGKEEQLNAEATVKDIVASITPKWAQMVIPASTTKDLVENAEKEQQLAQMVNTGQFLTHQISTNTVRVIKEKNSEGEATEIGGIPVSRSIGTEATPCRLDKDAQCFFQTAEKSTDSSVSSNDVNTQCLLLVDAQVKESAVAFTNSKCISLCDTSVQFCRDSRNACIRLPADIEVAADASVECCSHLHEMAVNTDSVEKFDTASQAVSSTRTV